jgi:hypothetical protein
MVAEVGAAAQQMQLCPAGPAAGVPPSFLSESVYNARCNLAEEGSVSDRPIMGNRGSKDTTEDKEEAQPEAGQTARVAGSAGDSAGLEQEVLELKAMVRLLQQQGGPVGGRSGDDARPGRGEVQDYRPDEGVLRGPGNGASRGPDEGVFRGLGIDALRGQDGGVCRGLSNGSLGGPNEGVLRVSGSPRDPAEDGPRGYEAEAEIPIAELSLLVDMIIAQGWDATLLEIDARSGARRERSLGLAPGGILAEIARAMASPTQIVTLMGKSGGVTLLERRLTSRCVPISPDRARQGPACERDVQWAAGVGAGESAYTPP